MSKGEHRWCHKGFDGTASINGQLWSCQSYHTAVYFVVQANTVTEVVSFFRCVARHVKFNALSINILCFCLMNLETTTKVLNHHYSLHQTKKYDLLLYVKNAMCSEATAKFNVIFPAIKWAQDNSEITISGKSGKQVQWSNYATNGNDIQTLLKQYMQDKSASVVVSEVQMWRKKKVILLKHSTCAIVNPPCTNIDDLQHQVICIFPHYVDLNHICSTVCQKIAWMGWHRS
ncbi:hypothetical protein PR048_026695 [Dryococelus australis]|uniref:Uncharacterized protein n=1 Tax=Dryococelus australis TaxID=614101 RepID=A0ABQ9GM24_9NEOP|nr:hypothetical protein PR048_026695 [Dryococelus australis]